MEKTEELLGRAEALFKERKRNRELLRLLSDRKLRHHKNSRLYALKGIALRRSAKKSVFSQAIGAFTDAIKLNDKDSLLYNERGLVWRRLGHIDNAIKDFSTAISLDPEEPISYARRALAYAFLKKRTLARKDYLSAIWLDMKRPLPPYHRRMVWQRAKMKTSELNGYARALKLSDSTNDRAYSMLGDMYYSRRNYELAFEQYNRAIELNPQVGFSTVDPTLVNMFNATAGLGSSHRIEIYKACIPISNLIDTVRQFTHQGFEEGSVVHFTKLSVADVLLSSDESRFRYYHVSYMNDPEEGKILLDILKDDDIDKSFNAGGSREENNFYLGSFLPESHADELVMWRTYGKDEQESEARGCSVIIDRGFFYDKPEELRAKPEEPVDLKKRKDKEKDPKKPRPSDDPTLRKVIYYNKNSKTILGDDGVEIMKVLVKLRLRLKKVISKFKDRDADVPDSPVNRAIDSIVYYVITELRYIFKSSDYAYENEERVIRFVRPRSELVKIEEGNTLPKRLYVEAKNPIRKYVRKVVLGPRVIHPDRWLYLKVKAIKGDNEVQLIKSNCKFQ